MKWMAKEPMNKTLIYRVMRTLDKKKVLTMMKMMEKVNSKML
jgi:hypothetical protein